MEINFIFNDNVCVLCLSCNVKSTKQQPSCLKIAETIVVLIVFNCVICVVGTYTVTATVSVALHESGTSKALYYVHD